MGTLDGRVRSGSQQMGIWPILRELVSPFSWSQALINSASGSTATRCRPAARTARSTSRRTRDGDRYAAVGRVPEPGRVDAEVVALPGGQLSGLQLTDDRRRLDEHVLALVDRRPALAGDVLVEVLPGAEAEDEPAVREQLQRRGLLRHHRRVVADDRAGHIGGQLDVRGGLRHRTQHGPGVRCVSLGVSHGE